MIDLGIAGDKDIVLDQDAFQNASDRLGNLSENVLSLRRQVEEELDKLMKGFDTSAGWKFKAACEERLLKPMQDLSTVITHIAQNLQVARESYDSVFLEYERLNSLIRNVGVN